MCGRYTLTATAEDIQVLFGLEPDAFPKTYAPTYNAAPSQSLLAIIHDGIRSMAGHLDWGFTSLDPRGKSSERVINVRSETVMDKPMFRTPFQHRRLIIPADSYYEWVMTDKGKQPM